MPLYVLPHILAENGKFHHIILRLWLDWFCDGGGDKFLEDWVQVSSGLKSIACVMRELLKTDQKLIQVSCFVPTLKNTTIHIHSIALEGCGYSLLGYVLPPPPQSPLLTPPWSPLPPPTHRFLRRYPRASQLLWPLTDRILLSS